MAKIMDTAEAAKLVKDGDSILISGFYGIGSPADVIDAILTQGTKDLTIISNDGGAPELGAGKFIYSGRCKKFICTWTGRTPLAPELWERGEMDFELCPQGSFVERIRAGGYGLGGILTKAGLNTEVEKRWGQRITLNGEDWLYHTPIKADIALIEAERADEQGNLIFHKAQRNFSPVMCFAAKTTIVMVNHPIEPAGSLDPEQIVVPGVAVDVLIQPTKGV